MVMKILKLSNGLLCVNSKNICDLILVNHLLFYSIRLIQVKRNKYISFSFSHLEDYLFMVMTWSSTYVWIRRCKVNYTVRSVWAIVNDECYCEWWRIIRLYTEVSEKQMNGVHLLQYIAFLCTYFLSCIVKVF
jgi:hypothetical protein